MKLTDDIKNAAQLEVRQSPDPETYFEAVSESKDIEAIGRILTAALGVPLKPAGKVGDV